MTHPANRVQVKGAPGFEDFEAGVIPGLHEVSTAADVEPRTVVVDAAGGIFVVPSRCVTFIDSPEAAAYRAEWATKADRSPRDVYIPEALR